MSARLARQREFSSSTEQGGKHEIRVCALELGERIINKRGLNPHSDGFDPKDTKDPQAQIWGGIISERSKQSRRLWEHGGTQGHPAVSPVN